MWTLPLVVAHENKHELMSKSYLLSQIRARKRKKCNVKLTFVVDF
jgi:hypothetical protein